MDRPNGIDIWDGIELKRVKGRTEEERQRIIEETLKEADETAKEYLDSLSATKEK